MTQTEGGGYTALMNLFESILRTLATALVLTAAVTVTAQGPGPNYTPGIWIQPANGPMPQYAAGTCNTISASIYAYPAPGGGGCNIVLARLYLGTDSLGWTKVDEYVWPTGEPTTPTTTLGVRFDSTHYEDGTNLGVKVQYLDNLGRYFYEVKYHPVKNKALLGNYYFSPVWLTQSYPVLEAAIGSRYSVIKKVNGELLYNSWKSQVPGANFIYVSTHGTPGVYEMEGSSPADAVQLGPLSDADTHGGWVVSAMGGTSGPFPVITPSPPYNNPSIPPCNFMFLDACDVFTSDSLNVLFPFLNQYAGLGLPVPINQFVAGWKVKLSVAYTNRIAVELSERLFNGTSAYESIMGMVVTLWAEGVCLYGTTTPLDLAHVGYAGDVYTRVSGVYTFVSGVESDWYKSL